jgi:hypothetical protein
MKNDKTIWRYIYENLNSNHENNKGIDQAQIKFRSHSHPLIEARLEKNHGHHSKSQKRVRLLILKGND